jgi:hypothetical protein
MAKQRAGKRSKVRAMPPQQRRSKSKAVKNRETEELVAGLEKIIDPPKPRNAIELLSADQKNPPKVTDAREPKN